MQNLFVALGVVAWIIAALFGLYQTVDIAAETSAPGFSGDGARVAVRAPSAVSGGAAGGFAIAGGMCFVAAAIAQRGAWRKTGQLESAEQSGKDAAAYFERLEPKAPEPARRGASPSE